MTVDHKIDEQVDELIFSAVRLFDEAEKLLIDRYETAKNQKDQANVDYLLQKLAFLYTLRKDYDSAEKAYERWESESGDSNFAKAEAAFFFLNSAKPEKALSKANEVENAVRPKLSTKNVLLADIRSLFRALHIKGRALLKLSQWNDVPHTLAFINDLIQQNPKVQFGFEMDLIEECLDANLALDECKTYLRAARWSPYDAAVFDPRKSAALKRIESQK